MKMFLRKLFLLSLVSAVLMEAGIHASLKSRSTIRGRFKLLGSVKKAMSVNQFGLTSTFIEDWDYWESANSANWEEAKRDCKANGDRLLYMETADEVRNVTRWLKDHANSGSLYWVGGRYDVKTTLFIWDNGVLIGPDAPWGVGEPKDQEQNTRIAVTTIGEIKLKTENKTVTMRYICEGNGEEIPDSGTTVAPTTTPARVGPTTVEPATVIPTTVETARTTTDPSLIPKHCNEDNDLVIVVDSSKSIKIDNYGFAKNFTARLATTWVEHKGSRVAVIIYSDYVEKIFGLNSNQAIDFIKESVRTMRYLTGRTRSDLAINEVVKEFERNKRSVPKNMVFLTDGNSNNRTLTNKSANLAKAAGIRSFSIGIGNFIDQSELETIAGGFKNHVFHAKEFKQLLAFLRPVSKKLCGKLSDDVPAEY